ncbi:MAG: hypothetical protein OEZ68_06900 [Gammaproteobacteria bacterium]|nr:hypothetical protein [Gammaproteobacteria bacterium]MDH5800517.1 hypothetical protein [Gammaproteobacteria bacterium]
MMHFQNEDKIELKLISRTVSQALSEWTDTKDKGALEQRFNDILLGHHGAVLYVCDVNGKALFASPGGPNLSDVTMDNAFHDKVYDWSDTKHTYRI